MKKIIFLVFLLCGLITGVVYSQIAPITNLSIKNYTISRQEARWIYTLRTRYWEHGEKITIYHLPLNNPVHQEFVTEVLQMQNSQFNRILSMNINSGNASNIKEVKTLEQMVDYISVKQGSVGYISKDYLIVNGVGHVDILKIID